MSLSVRGGYPGFTLVELLIVIAVLAIGLTIAVPSMQEFLKNNRVAAQNNELVALISLAKSQAIRRNEHWQVRLDSDGFSWSGNVRPVLGELDPAEDAGCPEISGAIRCSDFQGVRLLEEDQSADNLIITFNNRGFVDPDSEVCTVDPDSEVCTSVQLVLEHRNCTGPRQKRQIVVLPTGQITSQQHPDPCS